MWMCIRAYGVRFENRFERRTVEKRQRAHRCVQYLNELTLRVLTLKLNPKYAQAYGQNETERYQWTKASMNVCKPNTVHWIFRLALFTAKCILSRRKLHKWSVLLSKNMSDVDKRMSFLYWSHWIIIPHSKQLLRFIQRINPKKFPIHCYTENARGELFDRVVRTNFMPNANCNVWDTNTLERQPHTWRAK